MKQSSGDFLGVPGYWTLEDLALAGKVVMFECVHCGHTEILDIAALASRHGPQTRVNFFKRNMACARCGKTGMDGEGD
ncbi:MAG: hypothetical protein RIB53_11450 [Roseitalea porphyridii]